MRESIPSIGTTAMVVQRTTIGFELAEANEQVVYIHAKYTN